MRACARTILGPIGSALSFVAALEMTAGGAAAAASQPQPKPIFRMDFDSAPAAAASACALERVHTQEGVAGRGRALALAPGEDCSFPVRQNLDLHRGTLSFWVRPEGWSDGEGRSQVFFDVFGEAEGQPFQLYIDSPPEPGTVRLVITWGRDPHQRLFQIYAPAAWSGAWQKIDLTWDESEMVLYANGEAGERLPLHRIQLPALPDGRLRLTPRGADASRLDEVEIWSAPLPADRIRKRFLAAGAPPLGETRLSVARAADATGTRDGRLAEPFWQHATAVPLWVDNETGFAGLFAPHARFAWDADALHVAVEAARTDLAPGVVGDDVFELSVAREPGGSARTLRIAPSGQVGEDPSGAIPIEAGVRSEGSDWTVELRIPRAALGGAAFAPGDALRLDLRQRPAAPGALAAGSHLGNVRLQLGQRPEGLRIASGGALAFGHAALALAYPGKARAELSVLDGEKRLLHESTRFEREGSLAAELASARGRLLFDARGEDGEELAHLETRVAPLEAPGLRVVPDPVARKLRAAIDLRWLDGRWQRALAAGDAKATLTDRGPRSTEGPLALALDGGRTEFALASGLAPGRHEIGLELRSPQDSLRIARVVEAPALPWLGREETPEALLEPWLPLGWDDDATVRVWGRRYRFEGPLLAAVQGQGGPLLRAPMRLVARTGAGEAVLATTSSEVTSRSATRADFRGRGTLGADFEVSWSAWIEYDGLVVSTLDVTPRAPGLRIDQLALEIPLDPRIARYLRGTSLRSTIKSGRVPWDGRRFESAFEPFLWLTNEDEGFLVFSESEANWVGASRPGALVVRGGSDAAIVLRLIDGPVGVPGALRYQLGFQGTPVKPLLPDGRAWNFAEGGIPVAHETAIAYFNRFATADGLWQLQRPPAVLENERRLKMRGVRPFYFGTTGATPDIDPTFRLFEPFWRSAWSVSYPMKAEPDSTARDALPAHRLAAVCPGDSSFQDRMLHDAEQLLKSIHALGLYTDTDEVFADDNELHGCGFEDAFGKRGVTWTILKKRRFAKQLAALLRNVGGERRYWMSHAHARLVPPVHGFADFFYPGEELTGALARDPWFYVSGLDETAWRAEYRGESSGIVHVFLPEFLRGSGKREHIEQAQPTESMLSMAAVNDVNVSAAWTNPEAVGVHWGLRARLGLVNATFVGYWRADCPVRALDAEGRASLYHTRKGPVLVVANRAAAARPLAVSVKPGALGLDGSFRARDERSGRLLEVEGERITVPLDGRTYTYVSLLPR
jgi:hypothetical protein